MERRGDAHLFYFSPDLSVGEVIFQEMQRHQQLIAQISYTEKTVLTREELLVNSMRIATYLRKLDIGQSDIVGIVVKSTTHSVAVAYACFFNGTAYNSINVTYDREVIEKLFSVTKPKIIFCDGEVYEKVQAATESLNVRIVTLRYHKTGSTTIEEVFKTPVEKNFQPLRLKEGNKQTLAILCTSGSTGLPKLVTIPNSPLVTNWFPFVNTTDVTYSQATLDWIAGLQAVIVSGIRSAVRVISDKPFAPSDILQIIKDYKVTILQQIPSHMGQMVNCPEFKDACLDSLRYYIYGGENISLEVQQTWRRRLPAKCVCSVRYGFTELISAGGANYHLEQKPNSVGRLCENYKLKIINDEGEALGPNTVGEVLLRSGFYWGGYYDDPEQTRKVRDDDMWYHSNDMGYVDEDGFLYIIDRKSNRLKYQNITYYPCEVEKIIQQMPEVLEVCVFGKKHPTHGDVAAAAIVKRSGAKLDAQDVIDFVAKLEKAPHLQVTGGVYILDDLKRIKNGKKDRRGTQNYCLSLTN